MNNEKQHIEKELQEVSPLVKNALQNLHQQVPEGYFDKLEKEIFEKTIGRKNTKVISLRSWLLYATSAVAVFSLVFFGVRWMQEKPPVMVSFEVQIAQLSSQELETFILENIKEIETDMLFETEYVSTEVLDEKYQDEVTEPLLQSEIEENPETEEESSENIFEDIDDATLHELLNDESLFEDIGL
ncbi:MAG: hypothetical protein ACKVPJ_11860 [Chitinophagales bacterium]